MFSFIFQVNLLLCISALSATIIQLLMVYTFTKTLENISLTFCASPRTEYALSICRLVSFPNGIFFKSI